jgi:hypothetical protein
MGIPRSPFFEMQSHQQVCKNEHHARRFLNIEAMANSVTKHH